MFMNENIMLTNEPAKKLYHQYAKKMPIIDYHCHLDPKEIYEDKQFENITEAWLYGDHYKWRLMRAHGVDEKYITGSGTDYEKFVAWANVVPKIIGNPLYTWTHLELQRFFGIEENLSGETASIIWEKANKKLKEQDYSKRELIVKSQVKVVCTTDDPIDTLLYHDKLQTEENRFKVLPAFRPDKALNVESQNFYQWFEKLESVVGQPLTTLNEFKEALVTRIAYFAEHGCRLSDHALDRVFFRMGNKDDLNQIYSKIYHHETLSSEESEVYKTHMLLFFIEQYKKYDWVMQLHLHAFRDNNQKMFEKLGPDTGYDGINDESIAVQLSNLLDEAEKTSGLPKTILYSLNPKDYPVLITLMGCYQKDTPGKLQLGSAWWFNDTRNGMREQLNLLAEGTVFGDFVGMLTDSRSFLSYTRHEYFRRVLCELVGEWIERGEVPEDYPYVGQIIQDISYNNAKNYFQF